MRNFVRNESIETRAFEIIRGYEKKTNNKVEPPIPIEKIIMQMYDLYVEWDDIEEEKEITVLGGLASFERKIILNSKHKNLFLSTMGLERSTIGHEAGHWEYDVDKTNLDNDITLELPDIDLYYLRSSEKYPRITSFRGNIKSENAQILQMLKKYDLPDQARIVNRFSAALNMPIYLINEYLKTNEIQSWVEFYKMKKAFEVSTAALRVRLEQLKLVVIKDGKFFKNKEEMLGQTVLQF